MMMEQGADNKENNLFFNVVTHNLMILGNYTGASSCTMLLGKCWDTKGPK